MTQDVQHRSEFVLFFAMSLGLGAGLWVLPAFDLLDPLTHWFAPAALLAGLLHGLMAWLGGELVLACVARRQSPARRLRALRWSVRSLLATGLAWWALSPWWSGGQHDARALLWQQLLPLLLWPAGLLCWADLRSGTRGQPVQQRRQGLGVVHQSHMGRGRQVVMPGIRQAGGAGRKNDLVTVAVEAGEQTPA